jgi:Na+/citrate or Na+/malate symporter
VRSYLVFVAGVVTGSAIATYLIGWFLSSTPETPAFAKGRFVSSSAGTGSVSYTWSPPT